MKAAISYIIMLILIGALVGVCLLTAGCDEEYPALVKARADSDPVVIRARAEAAKVEAEAKRIKVHIDDSDGYSVQEYEQMKRHQWIYAGGALIAAILSCVCLAALSATAAGCIVLFQAILRFGHVTQADEKGRGAVRSEDWGPEVDVDAFMRP
jgi:hypothetical protein